MTDNLYLNFINYQRSDRLKSHIGNDPTALAIADRILFGWQNSIVTHDGEKACCPTLEAIADAVGVSLRTVIRKIDKLVKLGLISKSLGRWANGATRLYFKVTDLLLGLITGEVKPDHKSNKPASQAQCSSDYANLSQSTMPNWHSPIIRKKNERKSKEKNSNYLATDKKSTETGTTQNVVAVNFQQVEKEEIIVKQAPTELKPQSLNQDTIKLENREPVASQTITEPQQTTKATAELKPQKATKPKDTNPYLIGENLTKRQIAIINGAINNIMKDGVVISNPKQLKAEVAYKINQKHPDAGGDNLQHQINTAMKLIRAGKWTTPHGFYKYSDVGRKAAQKCKEVDKKQQTDKLKPQVPTLPDQFKDLFRLDLSGVGRGSEAASVNDQCDGATINTDTSGVSGNVMTVKDQPATESTKTGTIKMSQGGTVSMSQGESMGLSQAKVLSGEEAVSVTAIRPQSRADALNASIARCQARLAMVTGEAREALFVVIQRLLDELRSLGYGCVS